MQQRRSMDHGEVSDTADYGEHEDRTKTMAVLAWPWPNASRYRAPDFAATSSPTKTPTTASVEPIQPREQRRQ
jgi:hypothetical protein